MTNEILLKGLACASFMGVASAYADNRPNIIYIFTDQQTARAMSCAGNTDVNTPNMDRLAAAGIMFENAYCTAPLSGPSRAAMFTGHRPDEVNMLVNGAPMPEDEDDFDISAFDTEAVAILSEIFGDEIELR